MTPTPADYSDTALCIWREARGEGVVGMTAVACVIRNRARKRLSSYSVEVFRPWQFTSMSDPYDPEFRLMPAESDPSWVQAQSISRDVIDGVTADITGGATLYWNPRGIESTKRYALPNGEEVKFPAKWDVAATRYSATIGHHIFLTEV